MSIDSNYIGGKYTGSFVLVLESSGFDVLRLPCNGFHTCGAWQDRVCKRPRELAYPSKFVLGDL